MNRSFTIGAISLAFCAIVMPVMVAAYAEPSVWDGIYTQTQATGGQALYAKECASCHRSELQGHGVTPPLAGAGFLEKWDGQTVGDLFEKMQASMPADHPGRLSREENAAILAFMLRFNEFPAGEAELPTDSESLAKIRFQASRPK